MGYKEYVANNYKINIHRAADSNISSDFAKKLISEARTFASEYVNASLEEDFYITLAENNEAINFLLFDELVNFLNDEIKIDIQKLTRILELDYALYDFGLDYVNGNNSYRNSFPIMAGDKYRAILAILSGLYRCHNPIESIAT